MKAVTLEIRPNSGNSSKVLLLFVIKNVNLLQKRKIQEEESYPDFSPFIIINILVFLEQSF